MKRINLILAFFLMWNVLELQAQRFEETIKEEVAITSESEVVVKNVTGSIAIEGYSGNTILIEVVKEITADNNEDLELGKKELQLKVYKNEDRVIAHPDAPYIQFFEQGLGFNWCNDYGKVPYEHKLDFTIKVPNGISISASTVNDGEIVDR